MAKWTDGKRGPALAAASVLATILALEAGFRIVGYDFSGARAAQEAIPIFYRKPRVSVGDSFFRRGGPVSWTGNILSQGFRKSWPEAPADADPYRDGEENSVHYDHEGFRNPDGLENWEIAITGDSFTELGYLAQQDLFSAELARRLQVRVRNLGVSFTGPLTQLFYLERYAASPDLEHVILVFFEGNDLSDLWRERKLREQHSAVNPIERSIQPQTSLLGFLAERFVAEPRPTGSEALDFPAWFERHAAYFLGAQGELPVTLFYTPPGRDQIGPARRGSFEQALEALAASARRRLARPWLVYMPCKRRVLDGRLRFTESTDAKFVDWRPTDLPDYVREVASRRGVGFVDLTPAFLAETARGRLLYNPIWDTHLNRAGSLLAGRVIAGALTADSDSRSSGSGRVPRRSDEGRLQPLPPGRRRGS